MEVVLGPCPCQGCGQEVVWDGHGWLHESGEHRCPRRRVIPAGSYTSKREYSRLWMRQKRARQAA